MVRDDFMASSLASSLKEVTMEMGEPEKEQGQGSDEFSLRFVEWCLRDDPVTLSRRLLIW